MGKIQALNTVEEGEFQTCDSSLLSGMDAFAFGYEEWRILCRNKTLPGNTAHPGNRCLPTPGNRGSAPCDWELKLSTMLE